MAVKAIPDGYHSITPYLVGPDASGLLEFLKKAFGAVEMFRMNDPSGKVRHAEVKIGDSMVMLGEASDQHPALPSMLYVYVENADKVYQNALAAGAMSVMAPMNQFYGDRSGAVKDASGNTWWIATHVEDVPPEELARRAQAQGNPSA
jgi:PhnB protein